VSSSFEGRDVPFESLPRRIPSSGVFIAFVLAQRVLHIRRREVHGSHDGAGQRLRSLASVNGAGAKTGRGVFVEDASHQGARMLNVALKIVPRLARDEP
jgi:hypothetical protein